MSRAPEQAEARERVEFAPGQLAGDPTCGGETTARHDSMSASELQGHPLTTAEVTGGLDTFGRIG